MEIPVSSPAGGPRRRFPLFLIGLACFVLGPVIYAAQMRAGWLVVPWHWPVLATLGAVCMAASAWQRPGFWRIAGLTLFSLFCGLQWYYFGVHAKLPAYTGPAQVGSKLPGFVANYADGRPFTDKILADGNRSVVIFFRGRW